MSLPVHLVDSLSAVGVGESVEVTGDEAHHAVAVRRLRVGEQVALTDGCGRTAVGEVAEVAKRKLVVKVDQVREQSAPSPELVVVQALPKGDRGELSVEVLTEIGVTEIVPWAASRSVAVWRGERAAKGLAKWRATAREAAKQSRRSWFPTIAALHSTAEVAQFLATVDLSVILHEEAEESLAELPIPNGRIALIVGPEGGLSADEVAAFADAGAHTVRLGTEVLRTSTAGVAACAALLARTPRWRANPH